MLPVSKPSIGKEELKKIEEVFSTSWLGMGSVVKEFEDAIRDYLGVKHVVAVNTGTSAIHLAIDVLGIEPHDEIITPSLTYAAAIQAIVACGGKPVFCDVEEETLNIDVASIEDKLSKRTKAILPVHYCGNPVDMDAFLSLAQAHKLTVIEDACHSFGSIYKDKKIGSFGSMTCFSFDPVKVITCGEGGCITTNNGTWADLLQKKRLLGIDRDTWTRYKNERSWYYDVTTQGYRYHMSNINAAIGLIQMKKIGQFIKRRQELVKMYDSAFEGTPELSILKKDIEKISPYCYILRVKKDRDRLMIFLKERGIETGIHYIPNHLQSFFKKYATKLPVTERIWQEILTLPLYYDLSDDDVGLVIDSIKEFFK
ncbi:MAG: DegT/DnrJ/EryC1/StrS family aminotransferase [Candidatus Omnitrophota bacterium]|nr:DegT/DnrJ/EryC1/StrS family aminotransferase [Candidatus Omnitrophota bacterium]